MSGTHGRTCLERLDQRRGSPVLGHRDDHEIGDAGAVCVEVARRDVDRLRRRRDEHEPVGGDRRQSCAAPVEQDEPAPSRLRPPPSTTFDTATAPASPPPQRRQPTVVTPATTAVSRWSDGVSPSRDSWSRDSTVGRTTTTSGSGGPPRPIATTTVRRVAARRRAMCPVTAVLPTRLPVPITPSVGTSTSAAGGGSNRKSGPS